jgi:hypothetical protein
MRLEAGQNSTEIGQGGMVVGGGFEGITFPRTGHENPLATVGQEIEPSLGAGRRRLARKNQAPERPGAQLAFQYLQQVFDKIRQLGRLEPGHASRRDLLDGTAFAKQDTIRPECKAGQILYRAVGRWQFDHARPDGVEGAFDDDEIGFGEQDALEGKVEMAFARILAALTVDIDGMRGGWPANVDIRPVTHKTDFARDRQNLNHIARQARFGVGGMDDDFEGMVVPAACGGIGSGLIECAHRVGCRLSWVMRFG